MYMFIFLLASAVNAVTSDVHYVDLLRGHDFKSEVVSKSALQTAQLQIIELKKLVEKQGRVLAQLVAGQNKLVKYKSRELKKNKHTRRYLKKIYKSCTCESRSNPVKYYSKDVNDAKGDNSRRIAIFNRSNSKDVSKSKDVLNILLDSGNGIPDEGGAIDAVVPQGDRNDVSRTLRDSQVVKAPSTGEGSDPHGGDTASYGHTEDELRSTSTTVPTTSTIVSSSTSTTAKPPVMFGDGSDDVDEGELHPLNVE